jgi:hypothetical protein
MPLANWFSACRSPSSLMLKPGRRSLPHNKFVGRAEGNKIGPPENRNTLGMARGGPELRSEPRAHHPYRRGSATLSEFGPTNAGRRG